MPTVASFERTLIGIADPERASLLSRADRIRAHSFDLLGSGPTGLGAHINWHADFKTGESWPLLHHSIVPIVLPDRSDIKVPWELSRFQHLPILAAAYRVTGDRVYLDEMGFQLDSWRAGNPVELGPNWACTMEVAIRAANWVVALSLCAEAAHLEPWFERTVGSLLQHARFIAGHLEDGPVRGNHYLSNLVGLLSVASLFSGGDEGRGWARFARQELVKEMDHQVTTDGCAHEGSLAYHRLVCELFVCGTHAAEALVPTSLPAWYRKRLTRMLEFVADYTRQDGLAPVIGDADDGRFLPLNDYGTADPRWHGHLFEQAGVELPHLKTSAAYPEGGFFVIRDGGLYVMIRCGPTGMGGRGTHSHNDQLSLEVAYEGMALVVDPGTYVYTADTELRNMFRSTGFHSTVRVGGAEQNDIQPHALFRMSDHTRAELTQWDPERRRTLFEGRHHGFPALDPPASHIRRVETDASSNSITITDTVTSRGSHLLEWTFPLRPCRVTGGDGYARAEYDGVVLSFECDGLRFSVENGWYSPTYGRRTRSPFLRARRASRPTKDTTRLVLRVEPTASRRSGLYRPNG
jgi:hypothetical protein